MIFNKQGSAFGWLIVGLGNPGLQYAQTRHNAGFMAIDRLAQELDCVFSKNKFDAVYGEAKIGDERVLLAKPQTYMNLSGKAVSALSQFYKIPSSNIIVMSDDISLGVGRLRMRRSGSAGGHNGIKDIIELLGTENFPRIKIGVGAKPHPDYDLKDWVLGKIPKEQQESFSSALDRASKAVCETVTHGIDSAMNKYNG